ncbi:hypothetical protein H0H93_012387 [Arthromyces matolae]|nr:hypothetical protein H0H93_012387 [Arthromyces matolae]
MGSNKPRGLQAARKLRNDRRENRWADKAYKKRALGNVYKTSPTGGSSHAKGIVLEKVGVEAKQPNSAIRKCVRVQLIKNGKKVTAFVPNDGCLNFVDENDEVLISGFGRSGKAKGDIPGVRFKVVKVSGVGLLALWKEKKFFLRMSLVKPPLPPKRPVPPPPPQLPSRSSQTTTTAIKVPPPIPPKSTRPKPEDLARALARRPPPPPKKNYPTASNDTYPNAQRRLPPPPPPQPRYDDESSDLSAPVDNTYREPSFCPECRDYTHVDKHAALFPRQSVTSLDNLAYDLTKPFPNEVEKARAIFTWLHYNIAYDAASFLSGNVQPSTPESTLSSGLAVCDGYAGLFKYLAERIGIETHKVTGHGKGFGFVPLSADQLVPPYAANHAWNCAFLDGEWHLIDPCWGAGGLSGASYEQRFTPMWFTSPPREFGRRHFPEDPSYQLVAQDDGGPVSWEDYIMEPDGPVIFNAFHNLNFWALALQPPTSAIKGGTRVVFCLFKRCEHMSTNEVDNYVYMISIGNERVPLQVNAEGGWSADVYIPKGHQEVTLLYLSELNGKDAQGISLSAYRNARAAMLFGGLAKWTVV